MVQSQMFESIHHDGMEQGSTKSKVAKALDSKSVECFILLLVFVDIGLLSVEAGIDHHLLCIHGEVVPRPAGLPPPHHHFFLETDHYYLHWDEPEKPVKALPASGKAGDDDSPATIPQAASGILQAPWNSLAGPSGIFAQIGAHARANKKPVEHGAWNWPVAPMSSFPAFRAPVQRRDVSEDQAPVKLVAPYAGSLAVGVHGLGEPVTVDPEGLPDHDNYDHGPPPAEHGHGEHEHGEHEHGEHKHAEPHKEHGHHEEHGKHEEHGGHGEHGKHGEHAEPEGHGEHGGHGEHREHGEHGEHGAHGHHGHPNEVLMCETRDGHNAHHIAHSCHMASIVILCIFLIEISLKYWVNPVGFCKNWFLILDAVVITVSLLTDTLVTWWVETYKPDRKQDIAMIAGALLFVRCWRVVRIAHGLAEHAHHAKEEHEHFEHLEHEVHELEHELEKTKKELAEVRAAQG